MYNPNGWGYNGPPQWGPPNVQYYPIQVPMNSPMEKIKTKSLKKRLKELREAEEEVTNILEARKKNEPKKEEKKDDDKKHKWTMFEAVFATVCITLATSPVLVTIVKKWYSLFSTMM